jgi:Family of unknown function (DUF6200)
MANPATSSGEQAREHEKGGKSQIVVVELADPQSSRDVKRLRKGQGKLFTHVERIVSDLAEAGTVKASAQPVVIVVREIPSPLDFFESEDDDD